MTLDPDIQYLVQNRLIFDVEAIRFDTKVKLSIAREFPGELPTVVRNTRKVAAYKFSYVSSGHLVKGFLVHPKKGKHLPCMIYNRGGSLEFGKVDGSRIFRRLAKFASWGYVVIASQYSGNDGGAGEDQMGGKELQDVFALKKILRKHSRADATRIGMYGSSRGGMMVYLSLAKCTWIKAAVVVAGLSNLERQQGLRKEMKTRYKEIFGGGKNALRKRSALHFAHKIFKRAPLLLIHGSADWRVTPLDSLDLSKLFLKHRVPFRLVMFEGADHYISEFREECDTMIRSWFDRFLKSAEKLPTLKSHGD